MLSVETIQYACTAYGVVGSGAFGREVFKLGYKNKQIDPDSIPSRPIDLERENQLKLAWTTAYVEKPNIRDKKVREELVAARMKKWDLINGYKPLIPPTKQVSLLGGGSKALSLALGWVVAYPVKWIYALGGKKRAIEIERKRAEMESYLILADYEDDPNLAAAYRTGNAKFISDAILEKTKVPASELSVD